MTGLVIESLRAGYGSTIVLEGVSLELKQGGTLAVLGRNGVGKTTLLSTIMGHTTRHGGAIRFADRAIEADHHAVLEEAGGEGGRVTLVPGLEGLLIEAAYRELVR